jgi:hypothetical protein
VSEAAWVLHLSKAFSIQMSDFDWLLERTLKQMLDPVVVGPVPVRRGQAPERPPLGLATIVFGHSHPLPARLNSRAMQLTPGDQQQGSHRAAHQ